MTVPLAVAFLSFCVALMAVWVASEVSKKTLAKATGLIKDHGTEMLKLASQNDHAIAALKDDILELRLANDALKKEIAQEAEMRSREAENIREHLEDMESGWAQGGPKSIV